MSAITLIHYKQADQLLLPNRRAKKRAALLLGITVFLILFLLQPFGEVIHGFTLRGVLRVGSYALVTGLSIWVCELYLSTYFRRLFPVNRIYLVLLWYLLEVMVATSLIFLCKNAWSEFSYLSWQDYVLVMQRSFSIAIFPLALLFPFLINRKRTTEKVQLVSNLKSEELSVSPGEIIFLQSEDNYTSIYYLGNGSLNKKMMRGSLTSFEHQLSYPLIRMHRSYIVNLMAIESVKRSSQGYLLTLNQGGHTLKVSRKYMAEFDRCWSAFSGT